MVHEAPTEGLQLLHCHSNFPQRQTYQYMTTIMTEFGRPSVAVSSQWVVQSYSCMCIISLMPCLLSPMQNFLQDECIVQLYVKQINAFLAISRSGQVTSTANYSDFDSELVTCC